MSISSIKKVFVLVPSVLFSLPSFAELNPEAEYLKGTVTVTEGIIRGEKVSHETECFIEVLPAEDASDLLIRVVTPLQHVGVETKEDVWIALGSYSLSFLERANVYRHQDRTPKATVKDLVIFLNQENGFDRYEVLFWHDAFNHHDPIKCKGLSLVETEEGIILTEEAFNNFETLLVEP